MHLKVEKARVNAIIQLLDPLTQSDIPIYAVLGNHDYQVKEVGETPNKDLALRLEQRLEAVGIQVLQNEVVSLRFKHLKMIHSTW
jgi:uncharacterized protein